MRSLMKAAHHLAHMMHLISGIFLILMVLTVLVDVFSRLAFGLSSGAVDFTFRGGVEIVRYSLLMMVLFALPYSVSRGQVVVDLFTEHFPERVKEALSGIYIFGFALLGGGMAQRFYHAIANAQSSGETTQDLLIPLTYFYAIAAFTTAVLCLRSVLVALEHIIYGGRASS